MFLSLACVPLQTMTPGHACGSAGRPPGLARLSWGASCQDPGLFSECRPPRHTLPTAAAALTPHSPSSRLLVQPAGRLTCSHALRSALPTRRWREFDLRRPLAVDSFLLAGPRPYYSDPRTAVWGTALQFGAPRPSCLTDSLSVFPSSCCPHRPAFPLGPRSGTAGSNPGSASF